MKAAIENFARIDAPNKILVLGAMAELGKDSMAEHQQILDLIGKYPWKEVVLVGGDFQKLKSPYRILKDSSEAKAWFHTQSFKDTYFLVKGSRSMQMEKVLEQPNGHPEGN
jgi:UDP-N-acetylmuramoyl-tripeptide--D-alanyl-D-alanine ligase